MVDHVDNLTLGRGELWFGKFKPGTTTPDGYRFLGNVPSFNVAVKTETLKHYKSTRGTREQDRLINLSTERTATISCEDISAENLALFFLGDSTILSQASATGKTEVFTDVIVGRRYFVGVTDTNPTGYRSLTTPVLTLSPSTVLVAGTDYAIDAERGYFEILAGGAVADGDDVSLAFGVAAKSRKQIISGSQSAAGAFKFIAYPAEGDPIDFHMPSVEMSPNGDFALIADTALQEIGLDVAINTISGLEAIYADGAPYTAS